MSAIYDITQYWQSGDPDYTNSLNRIITAIGPNSFGGVVYVPGNNPYIISQKITASLNPAQSLIFRGDGQVLSTLKWTCNNGGIEIDFPSGNLSSGTIQFENISLKTAVTGGNAGDAVTLKSTNGPNPGPNKIFDKVGIYGNDQGSYWSNNITLDGCTFPKLRMVTFAGYNAGSASYGNALNIKNTQTNHAVDYLVSDCHFWNLHSMLEASDRCEGISFVNCHGIGLDIGLQWMCTNTIPLLKFIGGHINARQYGSVTQNVAQLIYDDTLIYAADTTTPFVGVYVDNTASSGPTDASTIRANILGGGNTNSNGVVVANGQYSDINCIVDGVTTGVWLQSGANYNTVNQKLITNCQNAIIVDQGTGNTRY